MGTIGRFLRTRWWAVALALVALAGAAAGVESLTDDDRPGAVSDLQRVQEAGERSQEQSERVVENLEDIVSNLEQGAALPRGSAQIRELTLRQQRSLEELAAVLRGQLAALKETRSSLVGTERSVTGVAQLGEEQRALVRRAAAALGDLRAFARRSSGMSRDFARRAVYGARLAEDSRDSFGGP